MLDLNEVMHDLNTCYGDMDVSTDLLYQRTEEHAAAEDSLVQRRAEIVREYSDPDGPHGGIKALGSNEEQRKAALDGLTAKERANVAEAASNLSFAKTAFERSRLSLQCARDMLRIAELERSSTNIAQTLLAGIG